MELQEPTIPFDGYREPVNWNGLMTYHRRQQRVQTQNAMAYRRAGRPMEESYMAAVWRADWHGRVMEFLRAKGNSGEVSTRMNGNDPDAPIHPDIIG